jgi:hypothetical protein
VDLLEGYPAGGAERLLRIAEEPTARPEAAAHNNVDPILHVTHPTLNAKQHGH